MKKHLKRPRNLATSLLPFAVAAAISGLIFREVRSVSQEPPEMASALGAIRLGTTHVEAAERRMIDEAFPGAYLPAPVREFPCPTGLKSSRSTLPLSEALSWLEEGRFDDAIARLGELAEADPGNWVPALTLGMVLAREGRFTEAESVLAPLYETQAMRRTIQQAVDAAARNRMTRRPAAEDVLGAIHLLHAYGYVLIESHRGGDELWRSLKSPIGCAKLLALRGDTDQRRRLPTWAEHRLAAPGCRPAIHSLTTLDLYNNLIVAYLEHPDFREEASKRRRELERPYDDPPRENPLLAVMRQAEADFDPAREHWLWAVSNAERLLRQRRESGSSELGDVRLAYNLAALMESALPVASAEAFESLRHQKEGLRRAALAQRATVLPAQARELDRGLVRLTLLEALRAGRFEALPEELAATFADGPSTIDVLELALARRGSPRMWFATVYERSLVEPSATVGDSAQAPARLDLGAYTSSWLAASRRDFSAALARQAMEEPVEERPQWARLARHALMPADTRPRELEALEDEMGFGWRLAPERLLGHPMAAVAVAILAACLAWMVFRWLALQLEHRRDLMASFYRVEAREQWRKSR